MASVGPLSAVAATTSGSPLWSNPDNVYASDDVRASSGALTTGSISGNLNVTSFGSPGVPTGATVDGILLEVQKSRDSGSGTIVDHTIQLTTGGTAVGSNKADTVTAWLTGAAATGYIVYGSATDKWGRTWTAEEANALGLLFRAQNTGATTRTARVDHFRVTIFYTVTAGTTYVDGASAPSGVATLTGQGTVVQDGSSAPSATASLTASGTGIVDGASTPSGTGDISASGEVLSEGSASLVASPSLSGSGTPIAEGSAQLTATGNLTADGTVIVPEAGVVEGSASLTATGSLTASGLGIADGASAPSAATILTATGVVIVDASASPGATAGLTVSGAVLSDGSASLTGVALLDATGLVVIEAASNLTALGTLAARGAVYDPEALVTSFKLRRGLQTGMRAGVP